MEECPICKGDGRLSWIPDDGCSGCNGRGRVDPERAAELRIDLQEIATHLRSHSKVSEEIHRIGEG